MYEEHSIFSRPENENVRIWRYVDIPKFLWLLERRALYFSRCDLLGDPFEGSLPSTSGQLCVTQLSSETGWAFTDIRNISQFPLEHNWFRRSCYVCSFHMNDHESAALWSIYAKAKQGVAIQSTFKRLVDSFKDYHSNSVYIGTVKYIDYHSETIDITNSFSPILHKRKSFEHEKEIRAVIAFPKESENEDILPYDILSNLRGINIPINIDCFIERIYLAPTTKPWIKELLTSIMSKNGINKPLEQSGLDANPII